MDEFDHRSHRDVLVCLDSAGFRINSTNRAQSFPSGIDYIVADALNQFDFGVELVDNKLVDGIKIGRDD